LERIFALVKGARARGNEMKREAGRLGKFLLCPQGKAASPRFMGVIVLGDVC
jgi:hypothetical protein